MKLWRVVALSAAFGAACVWVVVAWYQRRPFGLSSDRLVAHALGAVDGATYTNSREAFNQSRRVGFRLFEVDVMLAADSDLVASHVSTRGIREFGRAKRVEQMTRAEFLAQRYYGRFTPLDLAGVLSLAKDCPDCRFVIDAKDSRSGSNDTIHTPDSYRAIHRRISQSARVAGVLPQVWPQIYEPADLDVIRAMYAPEQPVVYTLYRTRASDDEVATFVHRHPQVRIVAAWYAPRHERFSADLVRAVAPTPVFAYTVNDPRIARRLLALGATGFYTDHFAPR